MTGAMAAIAYGDIGTPFCIPVKLKKTLLIMASSVSAARLAFVPAEWLVLVARRWMFDDVPYDRNNTWKHFITVVQSAARCEEGAWLLDKIGGSGGDYGGNDSTVFKKCMWVYCVMENDNSPRAKYYQGRALVRANRGFSQSAEAGFVPAMVFSAAKSLRGDKFNDPDALYWCRRPENEIDYLSRAAAQGHVQSIIVLSRRMCVRKDALLLMARYVFLTADWEKYGKDYTDVVEDQFIIGRELQGYEEFWDENRHPGPWFIRCIDVYLSVTKKARLAALCTVWALHHGCSGKDVAKFIGKLVYGTRLANPDVWI
jgi:hypothetical protein